MTTHGKMAAVRLNELELIEAWVEGSPDMRARFDSQLTARRRHPAYEDIVMPLGTDVLVTPPPELMGSAFA